MKRTAVALILTVPLLLAASGRAATDGKAVFLAQKCNMCHSVPAAGIEKTTKSEKIAGPDLPGKHTDAAFLKKYLAKEETIDGKKHVKEFKAADAEALINWILKQKK
jgi:cytochrome c5